MKIILSLSLLLSFNLFADGHMSAEKDVLKSMNAYFDARNNENWSEAVKYESKSGTYNTNSDGSFHKPLVKQSAASWAASNQGGVTNAYYPEAIQIADDVVFVRFYYEGMTEVNGVTSPYRTRVT